MDNFQLREILKSSPVTKAYFIGVYAADTLPKKPSKKRPCAYIANTREHTHTGEHWVAFYFPKGKNKAEYFDSYGREPSQRFKDFLGKTYVRNKKRLQSYATAVCGQYCVIFVYNRCRKVPFETIIKQILQFSGQKRDTKVFKFVQKKFPNITKNFDQNFTRKQICIALKEWLKENKIHT